MKISTWKPIANRAITAAGPSNRWVVHRRLVYARDARWVLRGVLADSRPYFTGPRIYRLCIPLFDAPLDFLGLGWSEQLIDFDGSPESLVEVERLTTEILTSLESEEQALRRVAYLRSPWSQSEAEEIALARYILGDYEGFREMASGAAIIAPAEYASPEIRQQEADRLGRVEALRRASGDEVMSLLCGWRNEFVAAMQRSGVLGAIEPVELTPADPSALTLN